MTLSIFFLSLVCLWLGANLITKAALRIARSMAMSEGFIGMTILALGTSFPEITVSVMGALQKLGGQDNSNIVVGNAIGASMNQLVLIVAVSGLFKAVIFRKQTVFFDSTLTIATILAFYVLSRDGMISRAEGVVFVLAYIVYLAFLSRRNILEAAAHKLKRKLLRRRLRFVDVAQLLLGLLIIAKSSEVVLAKGVVLASQLGLSEATVGVLLIGLGASLPEIVVAISAALRGASALSLGNVIGGTVVNIAVAMGLGASISGWEIDRSLVQFDIPYLLFSSVVLILFIATRSKLDRKESALIFALYAVYIVLKLLGF